MGVGVGEARRSGGTRGQVIRAAFFASALLLCSVTQARAQSAGDNAAAAADDAFGTTVGNESIGLYNPGDARGFSPSQAGNVRIEGLYFDQQTQLNNRISGGNTVRVGIGAQSYPFPAPTGIADFSLRLPGDQQLTNAYIGYGVYDTYDAQVDTQMPLVPGNLSIGFGARATRYDNDSVAKNSGWETGALFRWRMENAEVVGFWGRAEGNCCRQQPAIFTAGAYLPPQIDRRFYWGQSWTGAKTFDQNFGVIGNLKTWGDWTLRAGLFRSSSGNDYSFGDFVANVQPNGSGDQTIVAQPPQLFGSYSGEVRLSRVITAGDFRHTIDIALRGRDVQRYFGGADIINEGQVFIGQRVDLPEPTLTFGPTTHDHARQGTGGLSYDFRWIDMMSFGVGVQKTYYHRDIAPPGAPLVSSSSSPLLYNGTASIFVSKALTIYASYTKGLEESGVAPPSTVNRGEAMPASTTKQIDGGLRYVITPGLTAVAGVFQVEKPYFNTNAANVYGALGSVRHRGIELSLAGKVTDGISVVGGLILIQPRLSGDPVDRGVVGAVPPGPRPRFGLLSITYQPPSWGDFAIDTQIYNASGKTAHNDDQIYTRGWTEVNLGARYGFKIWGAPASLRAVAQNLTNRFVWDVDNGGNFFPRSPRRYNLSLSVDF